MKKLLIRLIGCLLCGASMFSLVKFVTIMDDGVDLTGAALWFGAIGTFGTAAVVLWSLATEVR